MPARHLHKVGWPRGGDQTNDRQKPLGRRWAASWRRAVPIETAYVGTCWPAPACRRSGRRPLQSNLERQHLDSTARPGHDWCPGHPTLGPRAPANLHYELILRASVRCPPARRRRRRLRKRGHRRCCQLRSAGLQFRRQPSTIGLQRSAAARQQFSTIGSGNRHRRCRRRQLRELQLESGTPTIANNARHSAVDAGLRSTMIQHGRQRHHHQHRP